METEIQKFSEPGDLKKLLAEQYMKQIGNFFGDNERAMRFLSGVMAATQRNPKLLECTPMSVVNSFITMAQLRLMPSDVSGEAYVLPYDMSEKIGDKWITVKKAQFQIGYKGLVTLFYRAGVKKVSADVIRENDEYSMVDGELHHEIDMNKSRKERGDWIGAYVRMTLPSDEVAVKYMNRKDLMEHAKQFSKSFAAAKSPWKEENDPELWMPKKTVLIQMSKLVPRNEDINKAIGEDYKDSKVGDAKPTVNLEECEAKLLAAKTEQELASAWSLLPIEAKLELRDTKNDVKKKLTTPPADPPAPPGHAGIIDTLPSDLGGPKTDA